MAFRLVSKYIPGLLKLRSQPILLRNTIKTASIVHEKFIEKDPKELAESILEEEDHKRQQQLQETNIKEKLPLKKSIFCLFIFADAISVCFLRSGSWSSILRSNVRETPRDSKA
ncbi:hypothetical protein GQR58_025815 [Nymphon striatum]|nr:hypothetical protein GQR58_025815 [Nymphon striatum]